MSDAPFPPCGIYLTLEAIGSVPAGRLVYFHNHGDPGPGIYLPSSWHGNRARFEAKGRLLPTPAHSEHLDPVLAEGFYRVTEPFHCCEKKCKQFEVDALVQLGYDAAARAIVFTPEWVDGSIALPDRGTRVERDRLGALAKLKLNVSDTSLHDEGAENMLLH